MDKLQGWRLLPITTVIQCVAPIRLIMIYAYPTEECDDYSGCKYMGDLAAFQSDINPDGYVSIEYVMTHNLVAFFDNNDYKGRIGPPTTPTRPYR